MIALADKMEPRMRDSFLRAVDKMKSDIDMTALTQSIANNDRVLSSMAIGDKAWGKLLEQSAKIPAEMFDKAGQVGAAGLKNPFNISASFTMKNPRAQAWARTNSSKLITQIGGETRKGIQQVIGSAYELGLPSKETARVIREMVGLTEKQGAAVFNFRERLIAQGRKPDQVARMTTKYEAKLLKYRSENIARTEIAKAGNEGLIESWRQAADAGLLDANNTNVEWLAAFDDRVCPICAPLNGTVYSYKDIESGKSAAPPAHPMCRCTLGISFEPVTAVKPAVNVPVGNLEEIIASTADAVVESRTFTEQVDDGFNAIQSEPLPPSEWPINDQVVRRIGESYEGVVDQAYKESIQSLSGDQRDSLTNYTGDSYVHYNQALRELSRQKLPLEELLNPRIYESSLGFSAEEGRNVYDSIKDIRSAIADVSKSITPPPPELVWRGTRPSNVIAVSTSAVRTSSLVDYMPGDIVSMSGFQSTSISPGKAMAFSDGVLLEIKPNAGVWVKPISDHQNEKEFLLPSDQRYKVVGYSEVMISSRTLGDVLTKVLKLEMLP